MFFQEPLKVLNKLRASSGGSTRPLRVQRLSQWVQEWERTEMGWSIGFDSHWQRDIGYGVPAFCDHPRCTAKIDRGLSYVCGNEPYGGDKGCGLYFCDKHQSGGDQLCARCRNRKPPFTAKPDRPLWTHHKRTHSSWADWRKENGIPEPESYSDDDELDAETSD